MKEIKQEFPFLITTVHNHLEIKDKIINDINDMGEYSFINNEQNIKSSDWHLNANFNRPYINHLIPTFQSFCENIKNHFGYSENVNVQNYWYQKYGEGDYHDWHIHPKASFSNVYYVSLPDGCSKTSFKLKDKEFTVDVKEGEILTFPAFYLHCSKPNQSKNEKIVVAFNI
jgi:hypothetical protein